MGAGIAVEFKRRCLASPRELNPGNVFLWREPGQPAVFNLATQEFYGRKGRARLDWVEQSLTGMRAAADEAGITSIAAPRLGAGLGGLPWDEVRQLILGLFEEWSGQLTIYELAQTSVHHPGRNHHL